VAGVGKEGGGKHEQGEDWPKSFHEGSLRGGLGLAS